MAPQLGISADNSPALRQVRINVGGTNVSNTLRQSSTNMGKLGSNQKWMQESVKRKTHDFVVDETPFKWQL